VSITDKAKILHILDQWRDAMLACDEQMDIVAGAFGDNPEGRLPSAVYGLQGAFTRSVADQLGWCDDALIDWWLTHRFGEVPMQAGFTGEPMRSLASNEDLAQLIAEDAPAPH